MYVPNKPPSDPILIALTKHSQNPLSKWSFFWECSGNRGGNVRNVEVVGMDEMSDELADKQLYNKVNGSRRLSDRVEEQTAKLLSDPATARDVCEILNVTAEQIAEMYKSSLFKRRLEYLSKKKNKPKYVYPKTAGEFKLRGMERLDRLGRMAKEEATRVTANKELVKAAALAEKLEKQNDMPSPSAPDVDALTKAFNRGEDK